MRLSLIIAVAVTSAVVSSAAFAQQSPLHTGGWNISGSASLSHSKTEDSDFSSTTASMDPAALYFIAPRFAFGGIAKLGYSNDDQSTALWTYGIGPVARYYMAGMTDKTLPFVEGSIVPEWSHEADEPTERLIASTAAVGITQMVATHVGVTGEAFYTHNSVHISDSEFTHDEATNVYGLSLGLSIFVH